MIKRLLAWLLVPVSGRTRQAGERCGVCGWCDIIGDDPEDEPNGYCVEPGNAAANHPYAGSFTHTESWCRCFKPALPVSEPDTEISKSPKT